jgi:hypothetical protein
LELSVDDHRITTTGVAIIRLTTWYGRDAAELISLGMEYPLDRPYSTSREEGR